MLYLLKVEDMGDNSYNYRMFETHTESVITGNITCIRKLVSKCKMEPVNMELTNQGLRIKHWPNKHKNYTFILLGKITVDRFKLIGIGGTTIYMEAGELKQNIASNTIGNCSIENGEYKSIDTYKISIDSKFEKHIETKYNEFRSKALILGLDISFRYNIENDEVRVIDYTGKSKKVIIPNFITTICEYAFSNSEIQELRLNKGLKHIGSNAFANNNINSVEIPKTVEFVSYNAFEDNSNLVNMSGYKDTVKKLSNTTILL